MKKDSTDLFEETQEQWDDRVDAMLRTMIVEAGLYALENEEPPPSFTRDQIGDFCGCSKDSIRRIEEEALRKVRLKLLQ